MNVNVKRARFRENVEIMKNQREQIVTFSMALGCAACREIRNFGKRRLNRLIRGAFEEITAYYEHYGGDPKEKMLPENIPFLYVGLKNQIKALDVPADELEKEFAFTEGFSEWRNPHDREQRKQRYENLISMEQVTRAFWYSMMLHLWHTYGWGGQRLTRFYRFVQGRYYLTMNEYLKCREDRDAEMAERMNKAIDAIQKIGVKL